MLQIIRGTTPTIEINIKSDIDLSLITEVWVYISQRKDVKVDKKLEDAVIDLEHKKITVTLSQNDTLGLKAEAETMFQIRLLLNDGTALASVAFETEVLQVYKEGVITNGQ